MNLKALAGIGAGSCIVMGLAACSSFEIHGTVTGKQYIPGYISYYSKSIYQQTCTTVEEEEEEPGPNGKGEEEEEEPEQVCSSRYVGSKMVPLYHADCWELIVSGSQGGHECVSESEFNSTKLGTKV